MKQHQCAISISLPVSIHNLFNAKAHQSLSSSQIGEDIEKNIDNVVEKHEDNEVHINEDFHVDEIVMKKQTIMIMKSM